METESSNPSLPRVVINLCSGGFQIVAEPEDVGELIDHGLAPEGDPDVRYVWPGDVVAFDAVLVVVGAEPVLLGPVREPAHDDAVTGQFAHVARAQLPHLGGDAVLFHQGLLGEVELKWVVGTQRHAQPAGKVLWQRVSVNKQRLTFQE